MLWRHLRNRFGADLLRTTADGRAQLERILLPRLAACAEINAPDTWLAELRERADTLSALTEMDIALERLDQVSLIHDRDLLTMLAHLLLGRHRRDARAWLRGESLPEAALAQLGLNAETDGDPEERARRLVLSLCRAIGPEMPVVFCFDQVEALQSHPQDLGGLHKFGQLVSFLRDETSNALLISCILSSFLTTLDQAIISSDRDRLAIFGERPLASLTPNEAKRLVEARLNASHALRAARPANHDRFWPLRERDVDEAIRAKKDVPRALLSFCAERFEQLWRPELITTKQPTDEFLAQQIEERLERAAATAASDKTDQIVTHGLPLLLRMVDARWEQNAQSRLRDADLVFEGPRGLIVISLCNQQNMTALAGRLRRLREQARDQILEETTRERFVLLRDARLPIGQHAHRTRAQREELLAQGFRWVSASAEMMAALDALRGLVSDARAGDLANGGETLAPATVQQWLMAQLDARLRPLRELLDAVLPGTATESATQPSVTDADFALREDLSELLQNHFIVSLLDAAYQLDRDQVAIEACALSHPDRFGLLGGPPPVLFQLVPAPLDEITTTEQEESGVRRWR